MKRSAISVTSAIGGWIASLPLVAMQMWVSAAWSSFAAPLAINVVFTLPNILVANSETYAPYYPWVQPFLAIWRCRARRIAFIPLETLLTVVAGSLLLFLAGGLLYFQRKAV